jgi:hypothetical protein
VVHVLEHDPDLAEGLDPERERAARRLAVARLDLLEPGEWRGDHEYPEPAGHLGLLITQGLMSRTIEVAGRTCVELLGPGDFLRPWVTAAPGSSVPVEAHWMVMEPTHVAVLDRRFAETMAPFPELLGTVLDRVMMRSRWFAFQLAVSNLKRVESRLLVVLWHFADRWGRVGPDGVRLELPVTHRVLAGVVGAQRPSVTTALGELARAGLVERRPDGSWLLHGEPPAELSDTERRVSGRPAGAAALSGD